jgi:hypothetical protein
MSNPNRLTDPTFLPRYSGPFDSFPTNDVRYVNWRFIMKNNVDVTPPVSPYIESFAMVVRYETTN